MRPTLNIQLVLRRVSSGAMEAEGLDILTAHPYP